jgi:hypothetical protein
MAVISGKIVIQVSSAILYGGGAARPGWVGSVNQLSRPVTKLVRMGPSTCGSARSSQAARSSESSQVRRCSAVSKR